MALLYATFCVIVLFGISSLAVDGGRAYLAKTELQNAVDAAARYASTGLANSTTLAKAQSAASENLVAGTALSLQAADVETGVWDSNAKTFTVTASNPNAVRVTGRRTTARGNAVDLYFAAMVGRRTIDVTASSVALMNGSTPTYKMVGINSVTMSGTSVINANAGEAGTASVASNGTFSLGSGTVTGDAYYRGTAPTGLISGTKTAMSSDATFTTPTTPGGVSSMGNITINSPYYVPTGTYVVNNLTIGSSGSWDIQGDADIYVTGNMSVASGSVITNSSAHRLRIFFTGAAPTYSYASASTFCAALYAPTASVSITGGTMVGTVVSKTLSLSGSAKLRYDSDWSVPAGYAGGGASGTGTIATVK